MLHYQRISQPPAWTGSLLQIFAVLQDCISDRDDEICCRRHTQQHPHSPEGWKAVGGPVELVFPWDLQALLFAWVTCCEQGNPERLLGRWLHELCLLSAWEPSPNKTNGPNCRGLQIYNLTSLWFLGFLGWKITNRNIAWDGKKPTVCWLPIPLLTSPGLPWDQSWRFHRKTNNGIDNDRHVYNLVMLFGRVFISYLSYLWCFNSHPEKKPWFHHHIFTWTMLRTSVVRCFFNTL